MNIKEAIAAVFAYAFLVAWVMIGAGIAWAVVQDNDQVSDMLVIGGFAGCIYFGITGFAALMVINEYEDYKKRKAARGGGA